MGQCSPNTLQNTTDKVNLSGVEWMAGTKREHIGHAQAENMLARRVRRFGPAIFAL